MPLTDFMACRIQEIVQVILSITEVENLLAVSFFSFVNLDDAYQQSPVITPSHRLQPSLAVTSSSRSQHSPAVLDQVTDESDEGNVVSCFLAVHHYH